MDFVFISEIIQDTTVISHACDMQDHQKVSWAWAIDVFSNLGEDGEDGRPSPSGNDPLPAQRVPPSILFKKSIFGRPTLTFF